jgi:hypothetical protein
MAPIPGEACYRQASRRFIDGPATVSVSTSSLFFVVLKQIDPPNPCRQLQIVYSIRLDFVPLPQQAHDSKPNSSLSDRSVSRINQLFPPNDCGFVG